MPRDAAPTTDVGGAFWVGFVSQKRPRPLTLCCPQLVEVKKLPRIKLSEDVEKVTMPGRKEVFRLFGNDGACVCGRCACGGVRVCCGVGA